MAQVKMELEKRRILIVGNLDIDTVCEVGLAIKALSLERIQPVDVVFSSLGGSVRAGIQLAAIFEAHGDCMAIIKMAQSAALTAASGCKYRAARPDCSLMAHKCGGDNPSQFPAAEIKKYNNITALKLERATGQTWDTCLKWVHGESDRYFEIKEALAVGLIHDVDDLNEDWPEEKRYADLRNRCQQKIWRNENAKRVYPENVQRMMQAVMRGKMDAIRHGPGSGSSMRPKSIDERAAELVWA